MANPGFLETPARRARLIGFVVDGMTDEQAAKAISTKGTSVSQPAITQFRQRHTEEIAARRAEAVQVVKDEWIADKQERIRRLQGLYEKCDDAVNEYGVMITEERTFGNGDDAETVTTRRFNGGMVKEMRGLLSDVADQLGQTPRPDQNLNIRAQVLYRQILGFDPEELG